MNGPKSKRISHVDDWVLIVVVGYQASLFLHAVIPIMKWRNDIHSLVDIIYIHPSLAEVVRGAARKAAGMLPTSCRDMDVEGHCLQHR
jgi:hypothetical protein